MEVQNMQQLKLKSKFLLFVSLAIFLFQHKIYASDYLKLQGKWAAYIYVSLPDGCILNDSTRNVYGIIPILGSKLYFNENGKGFFDNPARKKIIEFKWHLSNDTIHILNNDTLVLYKIDQEDSKELYLRLLSKKTKSFPFSYVVGNMNLKPSEFSLDLSIKKELEDSVRETINTIKEKRRVDEIVIGYKKDKKYHYTYLCDNKTHSANGLFDDIQNWKNESKFILFILYDEHMQFMQRITNYVFCYDKFMPEGISFETCEVFQVAHNIK